MDAMTKLQVLQHWHAQSSLKQQALVKGYLMSHPGISTSDDWLFYLAGVFGVTRERQGQFDLDSLVH